MVGASRWCLWTDWSPLWVEGEPHVGWAQRDVQVDRTGSAGPDLGESRHVPAIRSCKHLFRLQALELFRALSAHDLIYPQQSSKSEGISQNPALGRFQRPRSVAGIEPVPTVMLLGLLSRDRRTEQSGWEQCGQGGTPAQMEACLVQIRHSGEGQGLHSLAVAGSSSLRSTRCDGSCSHQLPLLWGCQPCGVGTVIIPFCRYGK